MVRTVVDRGFERRVSALVNAQASGLVRGGRMGVEKESLRVQPDGALARSGHPVALGSALTNPHVTTDYSEALIELVTPTYRTTWELLQYLCDLHQFVYRHIGDELLWATSMPCAVDRDEDVPIAEYGDSHVGQMKHVYRRGLGHRYGRIMQAIAGVHFNYSFPDAFWEAYAAVRESRSTGADFISAAYFDLLRNYRRFGWLILYLYGVSPAVCESFLRVRGETLPTLAPGTGYEPYATSLRMSDLGYRNRLQSDVQVSMNGLADYTRDLARAVGTPFPPYEAIGVEVDGEWRQLNTNVLQIENEFYSSIRPKRVAHSGERPTHALQRGGVEYIEVRALDLSPFDPVGVNEQTLRFTEAFLALCLMKPSAPLDAADEARLDANHLLVARRGRDPELKLDREGRSVSLRSWSLDLVEELEPICELLDGDEPARPYRASLAAAAERIHAPELTPSARLLTELGGGGQSFFELALAASTLNRRYFLELHAPNAARLAQYNAEAEASLDEQRAIESADRGSFREYLHNYFSS